MRNTPGQEAVEVLEAEELKSSLQEMMWVVLLRGRVVVGYTWKLC